MSIFETLKLSFLWLPCMLLRNEVLSGNYLTCTMSKTSKGSTSGSRHAALMAPVSSLLPVSSSGEWSVQSWPSTRGWTSFPGTSLNVSLWQPQNLQLAYIIKLLHVEAQQKCILWNREKLQFKVAFKHCHMLLSQFFRPRHIYITGFKIDS